jgi:hypothetical protein
VAERSYAGRFDQERDFSLKHLDIKLRADDKLAAA